MAQLSQFLQHNNGIYSHWCPACQALHDFHVDNPHPITGGHWRWDRNIVEPTFDPSMMFKWYCEKKVIKVCHYTLIRGEIEFQKDSTHLLAGVKMWIPPLPEWMRVDPCFR